jgi:hypothetical protein
MLDGDFPIFSISPMVPIDPHCRPHFVRIVSTNDGWIEIDGSAILSPDDILPGEEMLIFLPAKAFTRRIPIQSIPGTFGRQSRPASETDDESSSPDADPPLFIQRPDGLWPILGIPLTPPTDSHGLSRCVDSVRTSLWLVEYERTPFVPASRPRMDRFSSRNLDDPGAGSDSSLSGPPLESLVAVHPTPFPSLMHLIRQHRRTRLNRSFQTILPVCSVIIS